MPKSVASLTLLGNNHQQQIILSEVHYQGHGAYRCNINVQSNGFSCHKVFNFDNDEYFLAKLKEVLDSQSGEAELFDLQSDNVIKIQAYETDVLLVSGLILEEAPFSQSLEFAFSTDYNMLERFAGEFRRMVQANT